MAAVCVDLEVTRKPEPEKEKLHLLGYNVM
jgi:hypothetical protein